MATPEELFDALRHADKVGDVEGARKLADFIVSQGLVNLGQEPAPKPEPEQGDFVRGFKSYEPQLKETLGGLQTLLSAGTKHVLGENAVSDYLLSHGVKNLQEANEEQQKMAKKSDDLEEAWKQGIGTVLTDWLPYQMGSGAANVMEAGATALGGAAIGTAVAPGAGTAAGALEGVIGRALVRQGIKNAAEGILEKSLAEGATKVEAKAAAQAYIEEQAKNHLEKDELAKLAKSGASTVGQNLGLGAGAVFHGAGETTSRAMQEAGYDPEKIDYSKLGPAAAVHSLADFAAEKIGLGGVHGLPKSTQNILYDVGKGMLATGAKEIPPELLQQAAERYGAGLPLDDKNAIDEYINTAGGAFGMGVLPGAVGGARTRLGYQAPQTTQPQTSQGLQNVEPVDTTTPPDTGLQQNIDQVTGVATPPTGLTPLSAEEAGRQRILNLQKKVEEDVAANQERAARTGIPPAVPVPERTDVSKPSLSQVQLPTAASQEDLQAKQAEIDRLRLNAGLATGPSSQTPGVQPAVAPVSKLPRSQVIDERPMDERTAKNRLLVLQNMLRNEGGDPSSLAIVPHPTAEGKFAIQSQDKEATFTPNLPQTAITRPESPKIIDPVEAYIEIARRTNTPAAMRLVKDFEAGIVKREDIERAIEAEHKAGQPLPLTYKNNGEAGIVAAPSYKPRGERFVPPVSQTTKTVQQPPVAEPPVAEPPVVGTPPVQTPEVQNEMPKSLEEFRQRLPIASDKREVRDANNSGNFADLADSLAKSTNPIIRRIGQLGKGVSSKIKLHKPVKKLIVNRQNAAGVYRYDDDSIQMQDSHAGDEHTNAHETLHALIARAQRYPTERQKPIVQKIEKLYEHVKKELARQGKKYYGLTNVREFTAEAMSNPEFQYELMNIQYSGRRSAWTEFTELVAKLLGIQNTNALTEVLNLVDRLAQTKQPRTIKTEKNLVDFSPALAGDEDVEQMQVGQLTQKAKDKLQQKLQTQKPMPQDVFKDLDPAVQAAINGSFYAPNQTIVDRLKGLRGNMLKYLTQKTVDQFRSIKDISEKGYMQARLTTSYDGGLSAALYYGHLFNDGGAINVVKDTKGLIDSLKPLGADVDRFHIWMALNREANLDESKRSSDPNIQMLLGRIKDLEKGTINGKSRLALYQQAQKDLNALNRSVLKIARESGLIDAQAYKRFSEDMFYVPFYKKMEEGTVESVKTAAGMTRQQFSKQLKGGNAKPFGDLMENTLLNWGHILSASLKNQAATTVLTDASGLGAAEPNMRPGFFFKDGKVHSEKDGKVVGNGELVQEVENKDGEIENKSYTTEGAGKDTVKIQINGSATYFNINDPFLLESVSSISALGPQSKVLDVMRGFKNVLRFGVTFSPAFKASNFIKDTIQSAGLCGFSGQHMLSALSSSKPGSPTYIAALAGGGVFNYGTTLEGDRSAAIKRLIDGGVNPDHILDTPEKIKRQMAAWWRKYEEIGNRSENINRIALYERLMSEGKTHLEASYAARDLMDFSLQGASGSMRYLSQVVPFLNARVQGLYKIGRDGIVPTYRTFYNTVTGKPLNQDEAQKAKSFTTVSMGVALASMALYMAYKDDDDFKKREQWDRDYFWWAKIPGTDIALRIPKPFEFGSFGTLAERSLEQIVDQNAEGKRFGESIQRMVSQTFSLNPVPQAFKPLVDIYSNKDSFTNAPIETSGMERLSKQERRTNETSALAIGLGAVSHALSSVTGEGTELSPVQIDYMVHSYFAWLGSTAATASQYAMMPFNNGVYQDADWTKRMSLGFAAKLPSNQSTYVTDFYQSNQQISQAYADMRHYAAQGQMDKAAEILKEKGDQIALAKLYDATSKNLANIRKQINRIGDPNYTSLDGEQKKNEINRLRQLMSDVAQKAEQVRLARERASQ
jgi:Large polyvalent protein associated domain 38